MNDIREHWSAIKAKREELEQAHGDAVYIVSVESKKRRIVGGVITVASPHIAAMMIEDETHRVADPKEIRAWKEGQKQTGDKIRKVASDKTNTTQVHNHTHVDVAALMRDLGRDEGNLRAPVIPPIAPSDQAGHTSHPASDPL